MSEKSTSDFGRHSITSSANVQTLLGLCGLRRLPVFALTPSPLPERVLLRVLRQLKLGVSRLRTRPWRFKDKIDRSKEIHFTNIHAVVTKDRVCHGQMEIDIRHCHLEGIVLPG